MPPKSHQEGDHERENEKTSTECSKKLKKSLKRAYKILPCTERALYELAVAVFAVISFGMIFGLFVLHAHLTWKSRQMLSQLKTTQKEIPQGMYNLYFDYLEWGTYTDNVDMRANTSIFAH